MERGSLTGQIVALPSAREPRTWLWMRFDGDTEPLYFSLRADGQWREFPGDAGAEGLTFLDLDYSVSLPRVKQAPHSKHCAHGRFMRADAVECDCPADRIDEFLDMLEVSR